MEKTIAQQAKEILEKIPAERFITSKFVNGIPDPECRGCALGHFIMQPLLEAGIKFGQYHVADITSGGHEKDFEDRPIIARKVAAGRLRNASADFTRAKHGYKFDIADTNNSSGYNGYNEPVIKDRVIHLLDDMIAAGY